MDASRVVLVNASLLDPVTAEIHGGRTVELVGDRIVEVGGGDRAAGNGVERIDVAGRTLMPGLIDAHAHVTAVTADLPALDRMSPSLVTAAAIRQMGAMLRRGFTTVRDMGGADHGLARAVEDGHVAGPRIMFSGPALSQTGGHGDQRGPGDHAATHGCCGPRMARVCDGVPEVRRAARDVLRTGAHQVKLMLSGGVVSPTDRLDSTQFSVDEIRAAVEEAEAANRYVAGHAYTAAAIDRALVAGVRSIEHGNLLADSSIALLLERGAYLVPTLITYRAMAESGARDGLPATAVNKLGRLLESGLASLEKAYRAGVPIAFGTDLLGSMQSRQLEEFALRRDIMSPADLLRSATTVPAALLGMAGELGSVAPGARADLLVVDGDPLRDPAVLHTLDRRIRLVIRSGRVLPGCAA